MATSDSHSITPLGRSSSVYVDRCPSSSTYDTSASPVSSWHITSNAADVTQTETKDGNEAISNEEESTGEDELGLDRYGRKHVVTRNNVDKVYCYYTNQSSQLMRPPMKGRGSELEMREYIKFNLPGQLITNEYGDTDVLGSISSYQLPKLQAKLWREWPQLAATSASLDAQNISDDDMTTAFTVASVADKLEENYVFIIRDRSGSTPCSLPVCQQVHEFFSLSYQPYEVALEPLVDWATVDIVDNLNLFQHQILILRRNKYIWLEFGVSFKRFIPPNPNTLCVECLQFLWDRRVESWFTLNHRTGNFSCNDYTRQQIPDPAQSKPSAEGAEDDEYDSESWSEYSSNESYTDPLCGAEATYSEDCCDEKDPEQTPLQLDGTCEPKRHHSAPFKIFEDPPTNDEGEIYGYTMRTYGHQPETHSPTRSCEASLSVYNTGASQPSKSGWTPINSPLALMTTPFSRKRSSSQMANDNDGYSLILHNVFDPTVGQPFRGTFDMSEEEKYRRARAGFPIGPPEPYQYKPGIVFPAPPMKDYEPVGLGRPQENSLAGSKDIGTEMVDLGEVADIGPSLQGRQFGREITTSSAGNRLPLRASKHRDVQLSRTRLDTSPPRSLSPTFEKQKLRLSVNSYAQAHGAQETVKEKRPGSAPPLQSIITSWLNASLSFKPVNVNAKPAQDNNDLASPKRITLLDPVVYATTLLSQPSTPKTPKSPQKPFKTTGKHGMSTEPIGAQPWPDQKPPSEPPLLPPRKRFPAAYEIICACHKPAQTFQVKIVECWNPACVVGWYHYNCLDKSGKLSSRHGKWMCDACKAEKHWGKDTMTTDLKAIGFSPDEIVDGVDSVFGPGGAQGVRNPYGMGNISDSSPEMPDTEECIECWQNDVSIKSALDSLQTRHTRANSVPPGTIDQWSSSSHRAQAEAATVSVSQAQAPATALGMLDKFGYAQATPYWLTRAYSNDPSQFADEYFAQEYNERPYADEHSYWEYDELPHTDDYSREGEYSVEEYSAEEYSEQPHKNAYLSPDNSEY